MIGTLILTFFLVYSCAKLEYYPRTYLKSACLSSFHRGSAPLSSSASSVADSSSLVLQSKDSELIALRNKYILESIVSVARFSQFASRKLRPIQPLFKIAEELKEKQKIISEAQEKTLGEGREFSSVERVVVSIISLLTIWQRALIREMSKIISVLKDVQWNVEKKLKWLVHIVGKSAKPAVSITAGMFVLLADGWGPLYIIILCATERCSE